MLVRCQIEKSNPTIEGPPICDLMHSFNIKLLQIRTMSRHGGIIRKWCDIVRFLVSWGYTEISSNITYTVIIKNRWQPWTSPHKWWIHWFLIPRTHVNHPNFVAQHLRTKEMRQCDKNSSHCRFCQKNVPLVKYSIPAIHPWQHLVGCHSFLFWRTSLTSTSQSITDVNK
jgi:hypothetical protein